MTDEQTARGANGFEPWPGADDGTMPPSMDIWMREVYEPALTILAASYIEATGRSQEDADRFAAAVLARWAQHEPAIGVEKIL